MIAGVKPIETGVVGGIIIGGVAATLFGRYYRIELPTYLGFFAGKRFVPIITGIAAICVGVILSLIWPPVQNGINIFSQWAAKSDPRSAATIYGFVRTASDSFRSTSHLECSFFLSDRNVRERGR